MGWCSRAPPNGPLILTCSGDGTAKVFDFNGRMMRNLCKPEEGAKGNFCRARDGTHLVGSMNFSGQKFFCSVPSLVYNQLVSFIALKDFCKLHHVLHASQQYRAHWENNLCQFAHCAKPLFDEFTSVESLRWALQCIRVDVWGWKLLLKGPKGLDGKTTTLSRDASFAEMCVDVATMDIARVMVQRTEVDIDMRLQYGYTPLHKAAFKGRLDMVEFLCDNQADMEAKDDSGNTPLHRSAEFGHLPVVRFLCEQRANKEAKGLFGWTPLVFTAIKGHLHVVQFLCEVGAEQEVRDENDSTLLHEAADAGQLAVVQYLCEQGVDTHSIDRDGNTPLRLVEAALLQAEEPNNEEHSDEDSEWDKKLLKGREAVVEYLRGVTTEEH